MEPVIPNYMTSNPTETEAVQKGAFVAAGAWLCRAVLILFVICLGACGKKEEQPETVLRRFFDHCQQGNSAQAYQEATMGFRMEKSPRYFAARVNDLGFEKIEKLAIQNPQMKDGASLFTVDIKPSGMDEMQVTVRLHKEGGAWRVHEMILVPKEPKQVAEDIFTVRPRTEDTKTAVRRSFTEPVAVEIPSERELQKIAEETILLFNEAIQKKDFRTFFANASDRWKTRGQDDDARQRDWKNRSNRLTVAALELSFKGFLENQVDFSKIEGAKMILSEPARLSANGVLAIKGSFDATVFAGTFPPKPHTMKFKLEYVYESAKWKLFGIAVDIEAAKVQN